MKKTLLILLALLFGCVMALPCAADEGENTPAEKETKTAGKESKPAEKKKDSRKKAQRQKERKLKKLKNSKFNTLMTTLRQEFKELHDLQERLLRNRDNQGQVKELTAMIERNMKKIAPMLKQVGKIQGMDMMANLEKLIAEGKKLAPEGETVTDSTALELLQKKQFELLEKFKAEKLKGEKK